MLNAFRTLFTFLSLITLVTGCSKSNKNTIQIAATPVPHAEILEFAKKELKKEGLHLEIIISDDYQMPNRALAEKSVDANFFQHLPFLKEQEKAFGYNFLPLAQVEIEPIGIYSKRWKKLEDLPETATIAIPNDPSNEARALFLLEKLKLITLKSHSNLITKHDIAENFKNLKIIEADAAMLSRILVDVDGAIINTNYALGAYLKPTRDALALESKDSPYSNIVVIRSEDVGREELQKLKEILTSEKMRTFLLERYEGAILPSF